MKILFPIGSFYPSQSGGPNNTIYWIAKALAKFNVDVTVCTTNQGLNKREKTNSWIKKEYGKVIYLRTTIHYLPIHLLITSFKEILKSDIVHLTALFYPGSFICAFFSVLLRKKVIWSPRGELDQKALIYSTWKKKPILWFINKFLKKHVVFHGTSEEEVSNIKYQFGNNVDVILIPNYMDMPKLYNIPKEPFFLFIGRIHPKKAIENLLFALIESNYFLYSDFKLMIAGNSENDYGEKLKSIVCKYDLQDKVMFLGLVEGHLKQEILAKSYFSFMPSHTENFGNVVIEALSQMTPVVASKGTPWKILNDKSAGFWVENSVKRLSQIIDEIILMEEDVYKQYSYNALHLVEKEFSIDEKIEIWIDHYQKLLK